MVAERNKHPLQYAKAEALDGLNRLAPSMSWISKKIMGQEQALAVRWQHARRQDVTDVLPWYEINGAAESGRFPAGYSLATMLSASRRSVNSHMYKSGAVQAVAYADKSQVMIGTARSGELFDDHPTDDYQYAIGMRIGAGQYIGAMGVLYPDGEFRSLVVNNKLPPPIMPVGECPVRIV